MELSFNLYYVIQYIKLISKPKHSPESKILNPLHLLLTNKILKHKHERTTSYLDLCPKAIDADDHPRTSKGDVIAHEDEYGTLNAHTIHLPETSCLEVQMRTRTKKANGQNRKYPNKIDPSLLDDEDEEDTTGAFQEYYKEHDEDDDDFNDESETSNSNDDDKEFSALSNMDEIITETTRGINTWNNVIAYNKETRKIMKIAIPCTFSAVSGSLLDAVSKLILQIPNI